MLSKSQALQLVVFSSGSEEFGIDIVAVQEIILYETVTRMPEMPAYIEGLINLRGVLVPIMDLRKIFHLPVCDRGEKTRIIIVRLQEKAFGFIVDAVNEIIQTDQSGIEPPPASIAAVTRRYLVGIVKLERRLLFVINAAKLVDEQELLFQAREAK